MSFLGRSLFQVDDLHLSQIEDLFSVSEKLKHQGFSQLKSLSSQKVLSLVFFEASTRTRLSFEMAARRLGVEVVTFDSIVGSSVTKGESLVDTLETVVAMKPDLLVCRYGAEAELTDCLKKLPIPVINAGSGTQSHPTQALLDAFTIKERFGRVEGQRLLFVGDVFHSRVANSNLSLLRSLGADVAVCAPEAMVPHHGPWKKVRRFESLKEALPWCTVCMGLRIQSERHNAEDFGFSMEEYLSNYRIDQSQLRFLSDKAVVMHPGPFKPGVDLTAEVLQDSRCLIREQVTNGVFIRAALIASIFGLEVGL